MTDSTISATQAHALDVQRLREDFPILATHMQGRPLIYFDNAATSQKPRQVIDRITRYYESENANIHRAVYQLAEKATDAYENARETVRRSLNAAQRGEIIFVRGATEAINLVASAWGRKNLKEGDEVIVTAMEHHANLVPWQLICEEKGAILKIVPVNDRGELMMEEYHKLLGERTRFVSAVYISNSIGTINPIKEIIDSAHARNIPVLVDGCQAAPHMAVDVQALDCDFFVYSGHKVFAPTGIGVLYGKEAMLDAMPPYQSGGDMIKTVTYEKTTFAELPNKFEAGTPNIAGAVGLAAALDYLEAHGRDKLYAYEQSLLPYMNQKLAAIDKLRMIGEAEEKIPVFSFVIDGAHPLDLGTMLDLEGVAVRTGNHCTQPLLARFGVSATCRASLAFYNTREEIDAFAKALQKVIKMVMK